MPANRPSRLDPLAREALSIGDVRSGAIFVPGTTPGAMLLAAAAGIDGALSRRAATVVEARSDPGDTC